MKKIFLGLALHNHQPVGNFPWIFEMAYRQAYLPMVESLEKHPGVRLALHYSGPLLDWIRANHPDFIKRIAKLARRGQVEIMTGAYYEPILVAIPDDDKLGQIERMTQVARDELGYKATGLWLAERVWEPHLPKYLAESGVQWTVVDDTHFKMVGLKDEDLFGYYVTEEQGKTVKVFGTSKFLRYVIPWGKVSDVIEYLRSEATDDGTRIAVMGDDGEKFGTWPGTFEHCWERGWVESFFKELERNSDWLQTVHLGEYARRFPALGRVYLPTASYAEMMEWALPAPAAYEYSKLAHDLEKQGRADILRYLRGGFWRNFLVKYPEVNGMHKKMLRVHDKVYNARAVGGEGDCGLNELWQGQCNCPYWHGVFGGIYMSDIRAEIYRHLIQAENQADAVLRGEEPWLAHEFADYDCDSLDELIVDGSAQSLYVDLAEGGSLVEWDMRPRRLNLVATMTRRPEGYHQVLIEAEREREKAGVAVRASADDGEVKTIHEIVRSKEAHLERHLHYDWYRRTSMLDHFLHPDTTLDNFSRCAYGELGDFVNQPYQAKVVKTKKGLAIHLHRDGHIWCGSDWLPFKVEKTIDIAAGGGDLSVKYTLTNASQKKATGVFGSEWNFNLLGGKSVQAYYRVPGVALQNPQIDSEGEVNNVDAFALGNRKLGIEMEMVASRKGLFWRFPVEAISNSESGFERTYQGSGLLISWPFELAPSSSWEVTLRWRSGLDRETTAPEVATTK